MFVYYYSSSTSMIFGGDTLEYLRMANDVRLGIIPVSDKWMPLYSTFLGIISWLSGFDLFTSARVLNGMVTTTLVIIVNYILLFKSNINWVQYLLSNSLFFASVTYLRQSVTLMPEILFLSATLLFLFLLYKFIESGCPLNYKWLTVISFVICISWLIKYNGFVNLVLFLLALLFSKRSLRAISFATGVVGLNVIFYFIWIKIKDTPEFLLKPAFSGGHAVSSYTDFFKIQINDMAETLLVYFGTDRVYMFLKDHDLSLFVGLSILGGLFVLLLLLLVQGLKNRNSVLSLITSYIILYLILSNLRSIPVGVSEFNLRTLFYPLFMLTVLYLYLGVYCKYNDSNLSKSLRYFSLISFVAMTFVQVKRTFSESKLFHVNMPNISLLGDKRFDKEKSLLMVSLFKKLEDDNLTINSILTNQEKILGIHNNYIPAGKIPSRDKFNGNRPIIDEQYYLKNKLNADSILYSGKCILAYFYPRTGAVPPTEIDYVNSLDTNRVKIQFYPEGFLISSRSN